MPYPFTENSLLVLKAAIKFADTNNRGVTTCSHLLLALFQSETRVGEYLRGSQIPFAHLQSIHFQIVPPKFGHSPTLYFDKNLITVLKYSQEVTEEGELEFIYPETLFMVLLDTKGKHELLLNAFAPLSILKDDAEKMFLDCYPSDGQSTITVVNQVLIE